MAEWTGDKELFAIAERELYTAVIGDICDELGLRQQFISPAIHAVVPGIAVSGITGVPPEERVVPAGENPHERIPLMIGRAMPVLEVDTFEPEDGNAPFGKMLEALDDLKPGEIYICGGASHRYALVGELMATAMVARGARGAVCDGYIRDTEGLLDLGLPVYAVGSYSQDQRGRGKVVDYRVSIEVSGITVREGDFVAGDRDGVLIVPSEYEVEVFERALAKARAEKTVGKAIRAGMGAQEAFKQYGIL